MNLEELNEKYKGRSVAGVSFGGCSEEEAEVCNKVALIPDLPDYLEQKYREEVRTSIEGNEEGRQPTVIGKLTKEMVCWSLWKDLRTTPMFGVQLIYLTKNGGMNVIRPQSENDWNWKVGYYKIDKWMYADDLLCWMIKFNFIDSFWYKYERK